VKPKSPRSNPQSHNESIGRLLISGFFPGFCRRKTVPENG